MLSKCLLTLVAAVLCSLASHPISAQDKAWKDAMRDKFKEAYVFTKLQSGTSGITKPGTVLVVQKEGIRGDLGTDESTSTTTVRDGQIKQPGGAKGFMESVASSLTKNRKETSQFFKLGERVYIQDIAIRDNDIIFLITTCDLQNVLIQGTTHNSRFKALVEFEFPKKYLATADFSNVKAVIDSVLADEKGIRTAAPKTVELGQTMKQVEEVLGSPEKVVKLGAGKTIYVYKDLKVIFVNDKVADVQ